MPFYTELGFLVFSEGKPTQKFLINLMESVGQVTTEQPSEPITHAPPPVFSEKSRYRYTSNMSGAPFKNIHELLKLKFYPIPTRLAFSARRSTCPVYPFQK